ncbi:MAG: biotin--[acetyl-CoA-carboxylase] ligase, partial [Candidatus Rokuibacteriota bacterium]
AEGAADGTTVTAVSQSGGRGRRGRGWHDEPGASLLVSVVLRPQLAVARWPTLSLVAAVAVAETLRRGCALDACLKWPNDVRVGGRKIAGILLESRVTVPPALVVGVGVNLGQRRFPPDLAGRATSVFLERGHAPVPADVLDALLDELDAWRGRLERDGFAPVRARWKALAETLGTEVDVDGVRGVAVDLDLDGALIVEARGRRHRVVAGEVTEGDPHAARR